MNLRHFDLNLLVALDVLLTERNVTRAGERLFLTQPAVSGNLARLRHAFRDELLVRVGRNLELTAFAADLAGPVHDAVRQIEDLLNLRRPFVPESAQCSFRVAASDYVVFLLLGTLLRSLTTLAPNVSVRFLALEPSAGERLAAGELDFAVLPAELEPSLPSLPLFEDSWVCAVWSGHPHAHDQFTLDEFLAIPHLSSASPVPITGRSPKPTSPNSASSSKSSLRPKARYRAIPIARNAIHHSCAAPPRRAAGAGCRNSAHRVAARHTAAAREADLEPALHGEPRPRVVPGRVAEVGRRSERSVRLKAAGGIGGGR